MPHTVRRGVGVLHRSWQYGCVPRDSDRSLARIEVLLRLAAMAAMALGLAGCAGGSGASAPGLAVSSAAAAASPAPSSRSAARRPSRSAPARPVSLLAEVHDPGRVTG